MHDEIREYLDYNSRTGKFTWIKKPSRKTNVGSVAGTKHSSGYTAIMFKGKIYKAHRLAYYFMTGNEPLGYIDHINQKKVWQRSFINIDDAVRERKAMLLQYGFHPNHGDSK